MPGALRRLWRARVEHDRWVALSVLPVLSRPFWHTAMSTSFEAIPAEIELKLAVVPVLSGGPSAGRGTGTSDSLPRRRVLHLINGEHYAGAERVQDLLAVGLPEWGYDVGFACVKPRMFPQVRKAQEVPLYELPMQSRFDFRSVSKLCRIVDRDGYDLIHAHTPRTAIVGRLLAARRDLPMVYHVHSPAARDSTRPWINNVNAMIERVSLQRVACLITVSRSLAAYMQQQGYDPARIRVVANGVPVASERPVRRPPSGRWTLGTVALFRPRKGTEILLEALSILRRQQLDVRLRAVGCCESDSYQQELLERVSRLELEPHVEWTGFRTDINAQLQQLDLFVLPSLFGEGLPMVVLEAMAMGLPVIGTDVEGVPEAVRDRLEGRIARAGDATDLARAIASVVRGDCDWATLRDNAIRRQAECFSDVGMARGVAAVYDEVLQPAAVPAAF